MRLKRILWVALAAAILGVSWLWDVLRRPIEWAIDRLPLQRIKAAFARALDRLPPYPTLIAFLIPVLAVEPLKLVALWLLAKRHIVFGVLLYGGCEVLRLSLVSFFFSVSRDKLLSIPWFHRLYDLVMRAHDWAHAQVAPLRAAARRALAEAGLIGGHGVFWRKATALWRHARRGGFRGA